MSDKTLNLSSEYFSNTTLSFLENNCMVLDIPEDKYELENTNISIRNAMELASNLGYSRISISDKHRLSYNCTFNNFLRKYTAYEEFTLPKEITNSINTDDLSTNLYKILVVSLTYGINIKNCFYIKDRSNKNLVWSLSSIDINGFKALKVDKIYNIECGDYVSDEILDLLKDIYALGPTMLTSNIKSSPSFKLSKFYTNNLVPYSYVEISKELKNTSPPSFELGSEILRSSSNPHDFKNQVKFSAIAHTNDKILMSTICWINDTRVCYSNSSIREYQEDDSVSVTYIGTVEEEGIITK